MKEKKGFVTIGYGKKEIQTFIQTLIRYNVNCLVDVRSSPYSKYSHQYNKSEFEGLLATHNILYKWIGDKLGGRPTDKGAYDEDGRVNYEKMSKTALFQEGIKELQTLSLVNNVAIMCSEQEPINCHRFLAISRELSEMGYKIVHIKDIRSYVTQAELEGRLVKMHFGENDQINLFGNIDNIVSQSYAKQNKIFGYRRKVK